jgi:hypothetical protein
VTFLRCVGQERFNNELPQLPSCASNLKTFGFFQSNQCCEWIRICIDFGRLDPVSQFLIIKTLDPDLELDPDPH